MTKFTDNIVSYKESITKELIKLINNQLKAQASLQKHYARIMIPTDLMWLEALQELSIDSNFKPEIACQAMKKYYSDIINRIGDYYAKQGIDTEYYKVIGKKKYLDLDLVMQSLNYESKTNDDKMMYDLDRTGKEHGGVGSNDEIDQADQKDADDQDGLSNSATEKEGDGKRSEFVQKNGSKLNDEIDKNDRKLEKRDGRQEGKSGKVDLNQNAENTIIGDASQVVGKMQRKKSKGLFGKLFKHGNLIRKQIIVIRW